MRSEELAVAGWDTNKMLLFKIEAMLENRDVDNSAHKSDNTLPCRLKTKVGRQPNLKHLPSIMGALVKGSRLIGQR